MTTKTSIKLLLIEDMPDDEFLLLVELDDAGFSVDCHRVETQEGLISALDEGGWQVVISDYNLPTFDGLRALKIVRAWDQDVPFFFVSGKVEDAVGVEAMEGGANDYFLKDNLARLGPALRRELEEAERRRQGRFTAAQYAAIIDFTSHAIVTIDEQFKIILFNQGAEKAFGYREQEMLGQSLDKLLPLQALAHHTRLMESFANDQAVELSLGDRQRIYGRHKNGHEFPLEINISKTQVDSRTTFTAIIRDISDRQLLEDQLRIKNEELESKVLERTHELEVAKLDAEKLAAAKSDFLANMSHEIRTPMNAILGLAYILKNKNLDDDLLRYANKIHDSGEALLGILNDILDFSKIEAGKLEINPEPFKLTDILDNLATIMTASAAGKNLELIISPPAAKGRFLMGDALRLGQVLINLTSNAIKFTQQGFVHIEIKLINASEDRATLAFCVSDSGIGMDADTQARLFNAFEQADSSTTRRFGGTGLGLSISQRLVQMMGGEITVDSQIDKGSCFSFQLDFDIASHQEHPIDQLKDMRFLVVDDNDISLQGVGRTLSLMGWQAELFDNPETLLKHFFSDASLHSNKTVLIIDWQMPEIDGLEVVRIIRDKLAANKQPIMVMLTAHEQKDIEYLPAADTLDAILLKPLGPSEIYNVVVSSQQSNLINSLINKQPSTDKALKGLSMLIVDDNELNLQVASLIFGNEGASVYQAEDGQEAIEWLIAHPDEVDIVLMDVHMPVMDGLEATHKLRLIDRIKHLPVLALTAGALKEQEARAYAAGMNGFIPKPFVVKQALQTILKTLNKQAPIADHIDNDDDNVDVQQAADRLVNHAEGQQRLGSQENYLKYLKKFNDHYADIAPQLEKLRGQPEDLRKLVHKLRGPAGNFSLDQLANQLEVVETRIIEGSAYVEQLDLLIDIFKQTLTAITAHIRQHENTAADTEAQQTPDLEILRPLLQRALSGLNAFDPEPAEEALVELQNYLQKQQLQTLTQALDDFDYARAQTALMAIAANFSLSLIDKTTDCS